MTHGWDDVPWHSISNCAKTAKSGGWVTCHNDQAVGSSGKAKGVAKLAYVIAAPCVADYSCVEVCPVNCISPTPHEAAFDAAEQMYIDPNLCINCGACVDACPVLAIYDAGNLPKIWRHYEAINKAYFQDGAP